MEAGEMKQQSVVAVAEARVSENVLSVSGCFVVQNAFGDVRRSIEE